MQDGSSTSTPGLILTPNLVKGVQTVGQRMPDRFFYILYGDLVWECDGYRVGGAEGAPDGDNNVSWTINLICPECHGSLLLDSHKKKLQIESRSAGLESAEPIRCSHPAQFGGVCPWQVVLERSGKRVEVNGQWVFLDAVARRV